MATRCETKERRFVKAVKANRMVAKRERTTYSAEKNMVVLTVTGSTVREG